MTIKYLRAVQYRCTRLEAATNLFRKGKLYPAEPHGRLWAIRDDKGQEKYLLDKEGNARFIIDYAPALRGMEPVYAHFERVEE